MTELASQLLYPFFSRKISVESTLSDDLTLNLVLIFKESGLLIVLIKLLPHAYSHFRIFNLITLSGNWLFNLTPTRNMYYNSWLPSHFSIQPLTPVVNF